MIFRAPTLVVEVLSPSTQAYDSSLEFALCRQLASLKEYALVDPDTQRLETFRPGADGLWDLHDMSGLEVISFASVGVEVPLSKVFERVEPAP